MVELLSALFPTSFLKLHKLYLSSPSQVIHSYTQASSGFVFQALPRAIEKKWAYGITLRWIEPL
jgi:hypothetical protein